MDGGELGQGEGKGMAGEGNFKGGIMRGNCMVSIQYIHKPSHNAALVLATLVQMKNSEQV